MEKEKQALQKKIAEYAFVLTETNLYLDAYPNNTSALKYYAEIMKKYQEAISAYETKYGPITAMGNKNEKEWQWVTKAFPWQMED